MEWVLDCSLALAWALPDESSPKAERFLTTLPSEGALWVPALWWYELADGLATARRKGRLSEAESPADPLIRGSSASYGHRPSPQLHLAAPGPGLSVRSFGL